MKKWSTRKRVIISLASLLAVLLGAAGTVGYLTFLRPPANPPTRRRKPAQTARDRGTALSSSRPAPA